MSFYCFRKHNFQDWFHVPAYYEVSSRADPLLLINATIICRNLLLQCALNGKEARIEMQKYIVTETQTDRKQELVNIQVWCP